MLPAVSPGDWLLVDPTIRRWPRRGSIVVFREPDTGELAIKRVAAVRATACRSPMGTSGWPLTRRG